MKLGTYLPVSFPRGTPPAQRLLDYASAAERNGFDSLWAGDHLCWHAPMAEPLTTLSYLAAHTDRIRLGINVYLAALRPPALSARMLGNLWWLSSGRLVLGVGVGGDHASDFDAVGVPLTRRGALLDQAVAEIHRWWAEERMRPGPEQGCPLWVGGRSEAALRRVVRLRANGFTAHLVTPDQLRRATARLRALCAEAERPMPEVAVTVMVHVHDGTNSGAEPDAEAFLRAHFGPTADSVLRFLVEGSAEKCAERLAEFSEIADHVITLPATFDAHRQLDRIRELVEVR